MVVGVCSTHKLKGGLNDGDGAIDLQPELRWRPSDAVIAEAAAPVGQPPAATAAAEDLVTQQRPHRRRVARRPAQTTSRLFDFYGGRRASAAGQRPSSPPRVGNRARRTPARRRHALFCTNEENSASTRALESARQQPPWISPRASSPPHRPPKHTSCEHCAHRVAAASWHLPDGRLAPSSGDQHGANGAKIARAAMSDAAVRIFICGEVTRYAYTGARTGRAETYWFGDVVAKAYNRRRQPPETPPACERASRRLVRYVNGSESFTSAHASTGSALVGRQLAQRTSVDARRRARGKDAAVDARPASSPRASTHAVLHLHVLRQNKLGLARGVADVAKDGVDVAHERAASRPRRAAVPGSSSCPRTACSPFCRARATLSSSPRSTPALAHAPETIAVHWHLRAAHRRDAAAARPPFLEGADRAGPAPRCGSRGASTRASEASTRPRRRRCPSRDGRSFERARHNALTNASWISLLQSRGRSVLHENLVDHALPRGRDPSSRRCSSAAPPQAIERARG